MGRVEKVLYLAAHGGFGAEAVALGGGAAIFNLLLRSWGGSAPFQLETVTPAILGALAPGAREIVSYSEGEYARFCDRFREASTARVMQEDPSRTVVLVNDVSEGPDFARLAGAGYRIVTIYHVDVVAYIARIYLRGAVRPRLLTRLWRGLESAGADRAAPRILRLIFSQQAASVRFSRGLVVPSRGMKETLLGCYPDLDAGKVRVLPWGCPPAEAAPEEAGRAALRIRSEFGVPGESLVLLALSRISPEKGQDLLLEALLEWERRGVPSRGVWVFICGEPAFMQGASFLKRLRRLAAQLKRIKVVFPGYVTGERKAGLFAVADIYVFPSRHESYGLTLMEAMGAGLPSVALEQDGSRESLAEGCGVLIRTGDPRGAVRALSEEIEKLAGAEGQRKAMGQRAGEEARARSFEAAAREFSTYLMGLD